MCNYSISLDENLVLQAENVLQIDEPFQSWLQQQVEKWLLSQINEKKRSHPHGKLTDEMLVCKVSY